MTMIKYLFAPILCFFSMAGYGQGSTFHITPEAGLTNPLGAFKSNHVFAKSGSQLGLNADMMFGKFGFGLFGGTEKNNIKYDDLLPIAPNALIVSKSGQGSQDYWKQVLLGLGPILKLDLSKKFGLEFSSKFGFSKFTYPDYEQSVTFGDPVNKKYLFFKTKNEDVEKKLNPMLRSAAKLNFKASKSIDICLGANFTFVKDVVHSYTYLGGGFNPNMSNEEIIRTLPIAPMVTEVRKCNFNNIGFTLGIGVMLNGKKKPKDDAKNDEIIDPPVPKYPEDGSIISDDEADSLTLKWLKETPNVPGANYNLWLYEVKDSTQESDSLIYRTKIMRDTNALLPDGVILLTGRTYRFRVQSVDQKRLGACRGGCISTDSRFRLSNQVEVVLKKKLDAGYYLATNGFIRIKYDEEYVNNGAPFEFKVYDQNRTVVLSNTSPGILPYTIIYKDNRIRINLNAANPPLLPGFYVLEVKDRKGEISMLRFKK